jgi:hypothetical protein
MVPRRRRISPENERRGLRWGDMMEKTMKEFLSVLLGITSLCPTGSATSVDFGKES